jgi:signal transduction histidine kinase
MNAPASGWLTSIAVRQALVSAAVALVVVTLLGFITMATLRQSQQADLLRTIDTDIAGLADIAAQGGLPELQRRIADRTDFVALSDAAPAYLLVDAKGRKLAGNMAIMPSISAERSQASETTLNGESFLVRATRLRGGLTLVVGRSRAPAAALVAQLNRTFAVAALAAVVLSLFAGFLFARGLGNRVEWLNTTFARFAQGDLSARSGPSRRSDEIGLLGQHVDSHLAQISALLRAQREISDNIAHELRTPLMLLDTRLLTALERNIDEAVAVTLEEARGDIRTIVSLFDALLDLALADSRLGHAPRAAEFSLSELAANVADLYEASAEEAGLDFSLQIAPGVIMRGEKAEMIRLIANLLDNAFRHVPAGSRVRIAVAQGPRIVVEDNGHGIPAEDRERVFTRFHRSTTNAKGHGLGLALVKVIAMRHGLIARVEDAAPGARFIIEPPEQV